MFQADPHVVQLSSLRPGEQARIMNVDEPALQLELVKLGVRAGDRCQLTNVAPLGGPVAIAINGAKVALRLRDAAHVWVTLKVG